MGLTGALVLIVILTLALIWYAFSRQKYREKQNEDAVGTYWAVLHMLILILVIAPICYKLSEKMVLPPLENGWREFCVGILVLLEILIGYNLGFEAFEEKIKPGTRSFADSIDKISKIETFLMNLFAVAGFYGSVIAEKHGCVAGELNGNLLFGALTVFLDLLALDIYEAVYLIRGKEKPGNNSTEEQ